MRTLVALILGIVIGAGVFWYINKDKGRRHPLEQAGDQIRSTAQSAGDALNEKLNSFRLHRGDITNELAKTGRVIREKASQAGQAISDATADARITGAIKTKLL